MTARVTERSLYPPLDGYLKELGFNSVSEIKDTEGQLDILAIKEEEKFIIEVKIGDPQEKIIKGLEQAFKYAKDNETNNVIVINFPESIRTEDVTTLNAKALTTITNTFSAHKFLVKSKDVCPKLLFDELNELILTQRKINDVDVNLVVRAISEAITHINNTLRKLTKQDIDNLIKLITGKLDLFMALSELKKEEEIQNMTLNLISYLLVNQMLFYHIFSKKSNRIPELTRITILQDLKLQFKNITKIDYKSIYQINVLSRLPENKEIINSLNEIIDIFQIVKPELVEHDLIGRLFHDLLPYETRKILAAFYTNPIAADILAGLCINSAEDKVIDPACGSGTLLVSAYREKERLDEGNTKKNKLHHYFVEEELTGMDIMPFAAHLTAINLSSMNIETATDNLNVGVMDSLSLSNKLKGKKVYAMEEFSRELQTTIDLFGKTTQQTSLTKFTSSQSTGAVTADSKGSGFKIRKNSFDTVIANPPFSDREKMPNDYLKVLNGYTELTDKCGSQVNLWGYFLALNDLLLKKNGVFGFIIPINVFRGAATEKVRRYLLENYTIQYVVKTGKNTAFSENASLRDIIIVAKKRKPKQSSKFKFIILNEDLHELTFLDAMNISKYIKEEIFTTGLDIDVIEHRHEVLFDNIDNLMPIFGLMSTNSGKVLSDFSSIVQNKIGHLLKKMDKKMAIEGFRPVPAGSNDLLFITNNFKKNRIKKAFLALKEETEDTVIASLKDLPNEFVFPKDILIKSMRTGTDVNTINIEDKLDYMITEPTDDYDMLLSLSKVKNKEKWSYEKYHSEIDRKWTYMITSRRFRPNSKNTFLFAFYSETPFVPNNLFKIIKMEETEAKINTLFLNSSIGILNLILLKEQTTESYTDIQQGDLKNFDIIDITKLDEQTIEDLLDLYDEIADNEFKPLITQFTEQTKNRVKLDTKILTILGFDRIEVEQLLPAVYDAISFELKNG